jgi:hypothetical protein
MPNTSKTPRTDAFYAIERDAGRIGWTMAQYEHASSLELENAELKTTIRNHADECMAFRAVLARMQ